MKKLVMVFMLFSVGSVSYAGVDYPERCVKRWEDGDKQQFKNVCDHYVHVMYCDPVRKNSGKLCNDNGFYTHKFNLAPGGDTYKYKHPNMIHGVCAGMGSYRKTWTDNSKGEYTCKAPRRLYGN